MNMMDGGTAPFGKGFILTVKRGGGDLFPARRSTHANVTAGQVAGPMAKPWPWASFAGKAGTMTPGILNVISSAAAGGPFTQREGYRPITDLYRCRAMANG